MESGIDEAGRGPVIGPMVIVGIKSDVEPLKELNVNDSKLIKKEKRESLFNDILSVIDDYSTKVISPEEIDKSVLSQDSNLNKLEFQNFYEIILELRPKKIIIDCPISNNTNFLYKFSKYFEEVLNEKGTVKENRLNFKEMEIIAENKADEKYPIVSGASIIAKVIRDREIEKIKDEIGFDFGSGYPSDPKTKEFIKENWDKYDNIFRKSWTTWKRLKRKKSQNNLLDY